MIPIKGITTIDASKDAILTGVTDLFKTDQFLPAPNVIGCDEYFRLGIMQPFCKRIS